MPLFLESNVRMMGLCLLRPKSPVKSIRLNPQILASPIFIIRMLVVKPTALNRAPRIGISWYFDEQEPAVNRTFGAHFVKAFDDAKHAAQVFTVSIQYILRVGDVVYGSHILMANAYGLV